MRNLLQKFAYGMQRFMQGRYGNDEFSNFLSISGIVCFALSMFKPFGILYFPALILLLWSCFRCYSKNVSKRYAELVKFQQIKGKFTSKIQPAVNRFKNRKNFCYFKCAGCKTQLKVPKGKGRVEISCPKCKNVIRRKT